jgi:hypothetical protein
MALTSSRQLLQSFSIVYQYYAEIQDGHTRIQESHIQTVQNHQNLAPAINDLQFTPATVSAIDIQLSLHRLERKIEAIHTKLMASYVSDIKYV